MIEQNRAGEDAPQSRTSLELSEDSTRRSETAEEKDSLPVEATLNQARGPEQDHEFIRGVPTPDEIIEHLDSYVVGSPDAKEELAIAAHDHYKRNGEQLALSTLDAALKAHFKTPAEDNLDYKRFLNNFCREVRKEILDRKKGNPIRIVMKTFIAEGIEGGLLDPKPETFPERSKTTQPSKAKSVETDNTPVKKRMVNSKKRPSRANATSGSGKSSESMSYRVLQTLIKEKKQSVQQLPHMDKESVLLLGNSGSGKTYLVKRLAEFLDVPIVLEDASQITEPGYEGENAANIPKRLLDAAGGDVALASTGIVFLDEICKKAGNFRSRAGSDVSGAGAQNSLLRLLEDHVDHETGVDMSGVMFILAGSFEGLKDVISKRLGGNAIGYGQKSRDLDGNDIFQEVMPEDLINYGFRREFVGRISAITCTDTMTEELLAKILTEPKDSQFKQRKARLEIDGVDIEITPEASIAIARHALAQNTGARGLKTIMRHITKGLSRKAPNLSEELQKTNIIDEEYVLKRLGVEAQPKPKKS